ncbi:hypothetical protein [Cupriavidus campinensis]
MTGFFIVAPFSQEVEPPLNPGRFRLSQLEAQLHALFERSILFWDDKPSEWFCGLVESACAYIETMLADWFNRDISEASHWISGDRICRFHDEELVTKYGPAPKLVDGIPW